MRYPKFLQDKGTISFVAPSFGCARDPYKSGFENAQKKWREEGYQLELGPNCYVENGIGISNKPALCGQELTDFYCNTTGDCIISCGGGELMCETLDFVDFDRIGKANPKWYMGYSDNTNMTYLLATLCDTASIYGPCAATFGMEPRHESVEDAMRLITGKKLKFQGYDLWEKESLKDEDHPFQPYNLTEKSEIRYILPDGRTNIESLKARKGEDRANHEDNVADYAVKEDIADHEVKVDVADHEIKVDVADHEIEKESHEKRSGTYRIQGRLLGGCLDCMATLLGTKYDKTTEFCEKYKEDGILWFIEACDLNLMGIRRVMWQLEHAGWFKHCSGFLIGRPRIGMGVEEFGIDHYQAFYEMLEKYHVPILMDADIGHLPPMMPLICGSYAVVEGDECHYSVEMMLK